MDFIITPRSPEYAALKEERSRALWAAVERVIPDIRQRAEVTLVGTPLTHERFLRRHRGSYGPAIKAGEATFPGELPGLVQTLETHLRLIVFAFQAKSAAASGAILPWPVQECRGDVPTRMANQWCLHKFQKKSKFSLVCFDVKVPRRLCLACTAVATRHSPASACRL